MDRDGGRHAARPTNRRLAQDAYSRWPAADSTAVQGLGRYTIVAIHQAKRFRRVRSHLEYWTKTTGNSGVSIRDTSRAKWGIVTPPDYKRTPSKIGYEIQINNRFPDPHPSGSIYGFMDAPKDANRDDDWNAMDIISRNDKITIKLNGRVVAEHAGDNLVTTVISSPCRR